MKAELKPEELRIRNLITDEYYDTFQKVIKVESIHEKGVNVVPADDNKPYGMHRFEKVSTNYQKGWLLLWGNLQTGTIDFVLNEPNSGKRKVTALKYVHQLQNLYFSLEGNELIFNHG